jgi:hypothetical protein
MRNYRTITQRLSELRGPIAWTWMMDEDGDSLPHYLYCGGHAAHLRRAFLILQRAGIVKDFLIRVHHEIRLAGRTEVTITPGTKATMQPREIGDTVCHLLQKDGYTTRYYRDWDAVLNL